MAVSSELEAAILRYYHVEKWKIGTIARQLQVHHSTVRRVLMSNGAQKVRGGTKPLLIDPYLPFILEILAKYPNLTASRLYGMVKARGFSGGEDHFRAMVARHRPRPAAEAYLRLRTLPGEQAQVDWGHFGSMVIGQASRPLMAFVMVLSYSRKLFVRFYLNAQMSNFLRGHSDALALFGGVPKVVLYDNLRSCVVERQGDAIRFNNELLAFAKHYCFEPRPVAVARGNEKGRVERAIRYVRDNFFAGRTYVDLADLNTQVERWCEEIASRRRCPEARDRLIQDVFLEEQKQLMPLPENPHPTDERVAVSVAKTPYVRYDLNDYSVPHPYVRKTLTVIGKPDEVIIIDGDVVVAKHPRSYDKGQQVEASQHIADLVQQKHASREHRQKDQLMVNIPCAKAFLVEAAARGYPLGTITRTLTTMLETHGATLLSRAMEESLRRGVPHPNGVQVALDKLLEQRTSALVGPHLHNQKIRQVHVKPHDLSLYNALQQSEANTNNGDEHE